MRKTLSLLVVLFVLTSCAKKDSTPTTPTPRPVTPVSTTPLISLPAGWKINATYSNGLPAGVQVYTFDSVFSGKQTRAFCFAFESSNTALEFKPVLSATAKTPSNFVLSEPGTVLACINGGFFGGNQSYSLVRQNNTTLVANIRSVNRTFNGSSTPYFPTRAALGVNASGVPSAAWVYSIGTNLDALYAYPDPSPNTTTAAPQPQPSASFPAGGALWNVAAAVGGSPMLIYNNQIRITDTEELIDINNTSSRPRSAIGYTDKGVVLLVAIQGDNIISGYAGLNLQELANMLKALGCTHAMNLDGGGSTAMIINGTATVRSVASGERAVPSVLMIKRR
jgi:hypothetical protein